MRFLVTILSAGAALTFVVASGRSGPGDAWQGADSHRRRASADCRSGRGNASAMAGIGVRRGRTISESFRGSTLTRRLIGAALSRQGRGLKKCASTVT
jgi:hypothetical protein